MRQVGLFAVGLFCLSILSGCTLRYSQTVVGRVARIESTPIANSDAGTEVGLGLPGAGLSVFTFSEPVSAKDSANLPCDLELTQVDYRGVWYAYYISVNFPEVETRVVCAKKAPSSANP